MASSTGIVPNQSTRTVSTGDVATGVVFGAIVMVATKPSIDPDVFWHLATGRWIWEHNAIPRRDPFSWSAPQRRWIAHEWLTEAIWHQLFRVAGWAGLILLTTTLIVGAFVLVRATCRRLGASGGAATALVGLAAMSCVHTWDVRPQMISLFLTAVFGWIFATAINPSGDGHRLYWCAPIMLLWANLHGGWIFGMAMLFAFLVAQIGEFLLDRTRIGSRLFGVQDDDRRIHNRILLKKSALTTVAASALCFANPNGATGVWYPFSYLGDNASTRYVDEWKAPSLTHPQYWAFFFLLLTFVLFVVVHIIIRRRRTPLYLLTIGVPFAFLGLQSVRNISQFVVFAAPFLAVAASQVRTKRAAAEILRRAAKPRAISLINSAVLVSVFGTVLVLSAPGLTPSAARSAQHREYPVAAVRALMKDPGTRVANDYDWGGYLLNTAPGIPVGIDGRPDMYGDSFVDQYFAMWWTRPGWEQRMRELGIDRVLAKPTSLIAEKLRTDPHWKLTYEDPMAVIFAKK